MDIKINKKKELNKLFSNTFMLYILQISGYIFPLLTFPYLTRVLGTNNYGITVLANAIMIYFQMFVDFGFLISATKECSINRDDKEKLGRIVGSIIQGKIILASIAFIVLIALILNNESFKDKSLFIVLSYIPIIISIFITDYLFRGLEIMSAITYRTIISKTIYMILIFTLIKKPSDYILIPIIASISNIFIAVWSWYYILKKVKIIPRIASLKEVYYAIKDSSLFFVSRIASTIYSASNTIILGNVYNNVELGLYGAANTLISSARSLMSPIADSIYPYMVKNKNYKLVKNILLILTPIIFIGTGILYIFSDLVLLIISGEEFIKAVPLFRAMLPLIIITLPTYLLGYPILGSMGKMKEANLSVVYGSIFHILGIIVLYFTSNINMIYIINLTCITETIILIIRCYYVCKYRGNKNKE
ncbi:MAG: oligosaccharide flippase family protein [Romboutsia timonensis]|uniref:oligosaccharide flippase family protein n=1 Tax=Romboutsia timonensis TaxID=1776391 RepID=UPI0039941A23